VNQKQVLVAIDRMFERFTRANLGVEPSKASFDEKLAATIRDGHTAFQHILYMVEYLKERPFDTPKANRWLGFIQGVLWMQGRFSINEMGKINGEAMLEVWASEGARFGCDDCAVGRDCPAHDDPAPLDDAYLHFERAPCPVGCLVTVPHAHTSALAEAFAEPESTEGK
jgi:hypothetical protein